MYEKPELPPLLPDGLHPMSLDELEGLCVSAFPLSTTRNAIMDGLREVVATMTGTGISCALWINGSFLTEKIDPADVDLVALIPAHFWDAGTDQQRALIDWLTSREALPKKLHRCDTHAEPIYPEDSPFHHMVADALAYWRNIYGRSVEKGEPTGLVVLELKVASQ